MLSAYKLPNGNLLVPKRAEGEDGMLGDGLVEVPPDDPEAVKWIEWAKKSGEPIPEAPAEGEEEGAEEPDGEAIALAMIELAEEGRPKAMRAAAKQAGGKETES